ncbi:hypothetical protein L2E82_01134 [Cichorium intybus]|uniref:Uncharacterized protein n=1 Tax=Cichorium intybus TaxID=13427 RepID=A0ACB9GZ67_CICIN|nr:hypothetical protein L2E82_01134 [Cichorium intybus]
MGLKKHQFLGCTCLCYSITKIPPMANRSVLSLKNDNGAEETPTLIDRKDNLFIISNFKSKYPVLQLDLLISDFLQDSQYKE